VNSPNRFSFHQVPIIAQRSGARWLSMLFGQLEANSGEAEGSALVVDLTDVDQPSSPPLGTRLFAGDRLSGYRSNSGLVVTNGSSWLEVSRAPLCIHGELCSRPGGNEVELLHVAFMIALRELRIFELHAAVICHRGAALVLVGPSGSGKSTTALAHLAAGCEYLGDDRVLLRERAGELVLLRYPAHLRATPATLSSFPEVERFASAHDYLGKRRVDVDLAFPKQCRSEFVGPTTLLFPEIGPSTALRPLSQQDAFQRLLLQSGSLVLDDHVDPRGHLALLRKLVGQSRHLALSVGPEWLARPPMAARALLEALSSGGDVVQAFD
jgi:hypothetical protein